MKKIVIKPSELPSGQITIHGTKPEQKPQDENPGNGSHRSSAHESKLRQADRRASPRKKTAILDVVFLCNSCGKKLSAPMAAEGKTVPCPTCGNRITVPPKNPQLSERVGDDELNAKKPSEMKFFCVRCGQGLDINRGAAGSDLQCPNCQSAIKVPKPADEWA